MKLAKETQIDVSESLESPNRRIVRVNEKLAFTKYLLCQELHPYAVLTKHILRISGIREVHFSKIDYVRRYFLYAYYVWNIPTAMRLP